MIRIAVLSLSLLTVMSGAAVAPAVADIIAYFPDASPLLGKMVLTTPALTIIPVALITGIMSRRVSQKADSIRRHIVLYSRWHRRGYISFYSVFTFDESSTRNRGWHSYAAFNRHYC